MAVVRETKLPGVGVKHDFTTEDGREVGVLVHRDGRRDVFVYAADDPDRCAMQVSFSATDTRTVAELLGTSQVNAAVDAVQQELEGLAIEWLRIDPASSVTGRTIGDGAFRTRTGVSVVAVIRDDTAIPAPEPDLALRGGDVVVCVGTIDGLARMRDLVAPS
ncbi:cation:proton antiporter regulatory subunit [Ilumatobacter sp.]|uniref:cation:proton antiporter regulatory subunit n=1 Tax=Ilumatobacter sp. TaxID=1967498 RepID=UPI003B5176E3